MTSSAAGLLTPDLFGPGLPRRAGSMNPENAPDHAVAQSAAGTSSRNFQLPGDASFVAPTSPRGWTGAWSRITSIANHISPTRAASLPPAAPSAQTASDPFQPVPAPAPPHEEAVMEGSANEGRVQDSLDGNNAQTIDSQSMDVGGQNIRHGLEQLLDGIDSILGDALENMNSHSTIDGCGLPAPSGVVCDATAASNDMDVGSSTTAEQMPAAQGDKAARTIGDGSAPEHQDAMSDATPEQAAAHALLVISDSLEGQSAATDRPAVSTAQDVDMEDGEAASNDKRPDTHGNAPVVGVIQAENNVNMADATQDDFTIVSCTRRTDADAVGAAPSTAAMPADNESLAGSEVPLASRTGLLTVEALQAIQELALVPSRAGSARGPPSDASGSITLRRRGRHSRSPALSTSSRSHRGFNPTTERLGQIYEYLVAKVMQDESQDSAKCNAIAEKRNQKESELEAARLRILVEKERYKAQYDVAHKELDLKRDTMRLLRAQYKGQAGFSRYLAKIGVGSRAGSDRRSRSRSRETTPRAITSRAASRQATPTVVRATPKPEPIDLTGGDDLHAGSGARAGRRAASIARSVNGTLASQQTQLVIKVGDVSDLMQPPPVEPKRGGSVVAGCKWKSASLEARWWSPQPDWRVASFGSSLASHQSGTYAGGRISGLYVARPSGSIDDPIDLSGSRRPARSNGTIVLDSGSRRAGFLARLQHCAARRPAFFACPQRARVLRSHRHHHALLGRAFDRGTHSSRGDTLTHSNAAHHLFPLDTYGSDDDGGDTRSSTFTTAIHSCETHRHPSTCARRNLLVLLRHTGTGNGVRLP
ncbi:hypothetical protein L1887_53535 [Cichorium endivia]|nr:hypothetical protein L1887_53535 [Cichorium endivia]